MPILSALSRWWRMMYPGYCFDKDGNLGETLIRTKQERLDNWHTLQELAGII